MARRTANEIARARLAKLHIPQEMVDTLAENRRSKELIIEYVNAWRECFSALDPNMDLHQAIRTNPDDVEHALLDLTPK